MSRLRDLALRLEPPTPALGSSSGSSCRRLHERAKRRLAAGTPARVAGTFGGFDYRSGGREQIWIAGGIGVTPFVSWIRSLDATFDRHVDFWYSLAHDGDGL